MEEFKPIVMKEMSLNLSINQNHHLLASLDYKDSDARIKTYEFSIEENSSRKEQSIEPLMEELKLVLFEDYKFDNRHVIFNSFFWLVRIRMKRKNDDFFFAKSSSSKKLSTETLMK